LDLRRTLGAGCLRTAVRIILEPTPRGEAMPPPRRPPGRWIPHSDAEFAWQEQARVLYRLLCHDRNRWPAETASLAWETIVGSPAYGRSGRLPAPPQQSDEPARALHFGVPHKSPRGSRAGAGAVLRNRL